VRPLKMLSQKLGFHLQPIQCCYVHIKDEALPKL